jgi:hypothetical protein
LGLIGLSIPQEDVGHAVGVASYENGAGGRERHVTAICGNRRQIGVLEFADLRAAAAAGDARRLTGLPVTHADVVFAVGVAGRQVSRARGERDVARIGCRNQQGYNTKEEDELRGFHGWLLSDPYRVILK